MISRISNFFENYLKNGEAAPEEDRERQLQLASAALMVELCKTDQDIDAAETEAVMTILQNQYDLDSETLDELLDLAEEEVKESTSLYPFTSLFNEEYSYEDKTRLIMNLWQVAYADGNLDRYEEHMIRKIADLLYVKHADFIRTKLAAKENLQQD